jgi:hypothetical protein
MATGTMTVTGSVRDIESFLDALDTFPQLVTYTSSGLTVNTRLQNASMQLQVSLWASTDPSWQNGRPLPEGVTPPPAVPTTTAVDPTVGTSGATATTNVTAATPTTTACPPGDFSCIDSPPTVNPIDPTGSFARILLVILAVVLFQFVVFWRIFTRAGQPGWMVLVPILNVIVMLRIVRLPWWWIILFFVPIVGSICSLILPFRLARVFGRGPLFGLGLLVLPPVFGGILAFGDSRYTG